jgi:dynein heavy chain
MVPNFVLFALIWSVGGALDENYRPKFNDFCLELINGDDVNEKYDLELENWEPKKLQVKLPDMKSVFDIFYDKNSLVWLNWIKTIPAYTIPKDAEYTSLIIPTMDNIRIAKIMSLIASNSKHVLFVGPTGTGKTISIVQELKTFSPDHYSNLSLSFSA